MIVKLITGHSFKGAAAYLLHDKRAATSERVAWTQTRNLETDNPHTAWKLMAATAMDADRLKAEAGKRAGRAKTNGDVRHLVISWHREEREQLDREQMLAAAEGALKYLKASSRQAIVIAHDEPDVQPHIHVLINSVDQDTGVSLSSSMSHRKLSSWARQYRRERSKVLRDEKQLDYCPAREENTRDLVRGDKPKHRDKPRAIIEAEKVARNASNDNTAPIDRLNDKIAARSAELGARTRTTRTRHAKEWGALQSGHDSSCANTRKDAATRFKRDRRAIGETYRAKSRELSRIEARETAQFLTNEKTIMGRMRNAIRLIDTNRSSIDGKPLNLLSETFSGLTSAEARLKQFERSQDRRRTKMDAARKRDLRTLARDNAADRRNRLHDLAMSYTATRSTLMLSHAADNAKLRAEWKHHKALTNRAYGMLASAYDRSRQARRDFENLSGMDLIKARAEHIRQREAREQDNERDNENDR